MSSTNKGIKWGHKNHLWRDAVLPSDGPSKGTIQNIYCFIDFSGSVDQDLVYTFLGKVVDMCVELKYTNVKVYGFGERLVEPRTLDKKSLKNGTDVALSQTWDFISSQNPGPNTSYDAYEGIGMVFPLYVPARIEAITVRSAIVILSGSIIGI